MGAGQSFKVHISFFEGIFSLVFCNIPTNSLIYFDGCSYHNQFYSMFLNGFKFENLYSLKSAYYLFFRYAYFLVTCCTFR